MKHMNIALAGLSALALAACGKNANLAGEWIQPVPGMPQMTQGFTLKEDGSASSVNMATLKYESWKEEKNFDSSLYSDSSGYGSVYDL